MPKLTGIDFIKNAPVLPAVIFTTAYPEYAIEGYELDVLDYLLKPISFHRFLKAAMKAREFLGIKAKHEVAIPEDFFFIKSNQKIEKIVMSDVLYVEGMSNYIIIHTEKKNTLPTSLLKVLKTNYHSTCSSAFINLSWYLSTPFNLLMPTKCGWVNYCCHSVKITGKK
nr:hypothetical protein [Ferruginibacter sp.]